LHQQATWMRSVSRQHCHRHGKLTNDNGAKFVFVVKVQANGCWAEGFLDFVGLGVIRACRLGLALALWFFFLADRRWSEGASG
jgi:hypothetical protein